MSLDLLVFISIAFLSSFGHCYSMCGGFVLLFLNLNKEAKDLFILQIIFHFFRILTYIFLGVLFSLIGNFFLINTTIQSLFFFIIGLLMIFLGFALIFRGKILFLIENHIFYEKFIIKIFQKAKAYKGVKSAIFLGFFNGFIPCGLVYFFIASAMSRQNILESALIMFIFGLSTLPALFLFSLIAKFLSDLFRNIFNYIAYFAIIFYGLYLSFIGFKNF